MYFYVTLCLLLSSISNKIFAQTIDFGTASSFVLFTITGGVSNAGVSSFIGDIGTNTGAISGFQSNTVSGYFHNTDSVTNQARSHLLTGYNQLMAFPTTKAIHAATFGGNETLTPGIFGLASAANVIGTINLDALGDTNAIFIFRFSGAFSFAASSSVVLLNGMRSRNVFWVSEGAIAFGVNSTLNGIFIANNAAVSMAAGCSLNGRLYSTTGAISVDGGDLQNSKQSNSISALPITLLTFESQCSLEYTVINWSTAAEINNNFFTILRSVDGIKWTSVKEFIGAGNSSTLINYSFNYVELGNESSYYRLKQTDFDGNFSYSKSIFQKKCFQSNSKINIYPNPANKTLNLNFKGNITNVLSTCVYNILGEKIYSSTIFQPQLDLEGIKEGFYFIQLNFESNTLINKFRILN